MNFFDLRKSKIKGHYRKLPNGRTVYIKEHFDKRKKKQELYTPHAVIHADAKSTTVANYKGEPETYTHQPYNELNEEDIHAHLNSAMTIDDELALKLWKHQKGIKDFDQFLNDLVKDEKESAKLSGKDPQFVTKQEARDYIMSAKMDKKGAGLKGVKQYAKELQSKYGHVTTYAKAYLHPQSRDISQYADASLAPDSGAFPHEQAEAKMMAEHSADAHEAALKEIQQVEKAQKMRPEDCPMIPGLSKDTQFFGHQAEALAKLGVLNKAIVDVDMGGGKGLLLPADAMNLMGQGKVKKPLVVVPGATLDQNASKIHEYTKRGMNVFMISNQNINEKYDGDVEKMVEDIHNAPPNTIFMASYDVFSMKDKEADPGEELARARALSAAGFDYVALDESHNIKNVQTTRFKSMKYLTKAKYKRVASGTFLSNNPLDVLGQLLFLHPQMSMTEEQFKEKYGYKEDAEGVQWTGLKQLRADLMEMGMISLRRSAWIDKLPDRNEGLSVVKMEPRHKAVHEAVLNDVIEQLQSEMEKSPKLKKFFTDDDLGESDELPPQALAKLNLVSGIADYPHEMAEMMEEKLAHIKDAKEKAGKNGDVDEETQALIENLMKMKSETRKAIRSLNGIVSPKAKDVYKKIEEHFKDKKNGKFIVFVQRKAAANHIINNMPAEMRKNAVYYDASKKAELDDYLKNPNGAKILVAVDQSIKEGVNMQTANGMYRYDHHWPVAEGTLVTCERGMVPIETLSGTELVETATLPKRGTKLKSRGIEKTVDVETEHGWRCGFALDHPVMVLDRKTMTPTYKEAQHLTSDDVIAIRRKPSELWTQKSSLTEAEAYFLGYMTANGWVRQDHESLGFCDGDFGHRQHFARLCGDVLRMEPECRPWKTEVTIYNRPELMQRCFEFGISKEKARHKELPLHAFTLGRDETVALLKGLWADGSIGNGQPVFYSSSRELVGQVQLLLQRLGVMSKIDFWPGRNAEIDGRAVKDSGSFYLSVAGGESTLLFAKTMGRWEEIEGGERNQKINQWAAKVITTAEASTLRSNWDTMIPGMKQALRERDVPVKHYYAVSEASYTNMDRSGAAHLFPRLSETRLTWSRVSDIRDGAEKRVWCIVDVQDEHNFVANGMVVHNSPGNQEQSYARIWRFGQDKPTNFTKGIVDGSIDVPKYARLMTKLHQNMQVTSEFDDQTTPAFKMGLRTLQSKNNADILPDYENLNKKILDFQKEENKDLQKRYGKGMLKRSTGQAIGGKKAEEKHGIGAYHSDVKAEKLKILPEHQMDALIGHFRENLEKLKGTESIYNQGYYDSWFEDAFHLAMYQMAKDPKSKTLEKNTIAQYKENMGKLDPKQEKFFEKVLIPTVEKTLSGKSHKAHEAHGIDYPIKSAMEKSGIKTKDKEAVGLFKKEVNTLLKKLKKVDLVHLGEGKVENPEVADKALKEMEKESGEPLSPKYRKMLLHAAVMAQEVHGGWSKIKHEWSHLTEAYEEEE